MNVFYGYLENEDLLLQSSSGGAVTAISQRIIDNGGVVFGARYTKDYYGVEYCCVDNLKDLDQLKGSKYTSSRKGDVYEQLAQRLKNGQLVLFVGLGCDVGAVKAYCYKNNLDTKTLYLIDILCHGPVADGVHEQFVKDLENRYNSKLTFFSVRFKKKGWTPFYIKAKFDSGKELEMLFNESDYGKAFYSIAKPACTNCKFKGDNHKGDLCCGDYWGITEREPGWNKNGVSVIVVQTDKGRELLNLLGDGFFISKADEEIFAKGNPMYFMSRQQNADYEQFVSDMEEKGLHYAVSQLPDRKNHIGNSVIQFIKKKLHI